MEGGLGVGEWGEEGGVTAGSGKVQQIPDNPRSLSQLDMIVMESLGQNPKEKIPSAAGLTALSAPFFFFFEGCFTLSICIVYACCREQADLADGGFLFLLRDLPHRRPKGN